MAEERPPYNNMSHSLQILPTADNDDTPLIQSSSNKSSATKKLQKKRSFLTSRRRRTRSLGTTSTSNANWSVSKTDGEETNDNYSTTNNNNNIIIGDDENVNAIGSVNDTNATSAAIVTPSSSTLHDLKRITTYIKDERHLVAYELYVDVKRRLDAYRILQRERDDRGKTDNHDDGSGNLSERGYHRWRMGWRTNRPHHVHTENNGQQQQQQHVNNGDAKRSTLDLEENEEAYKFWMDRRKEFEALEKRATMFQTAQQNLNTPTSWILSQTLFGITTHYRRESDNTLSIKIEGELHGVPLFEQMVILRECDLYHTWAPFCNGSRKLAQLDKLDVVAWYTVGTPLLGIVRDACYRAVGCDCMREDGSVLLVAVGLGDDENHDYVDGSNGNDGGEMKDEVNTAENSHSNNEQDQTEDKQLFTESSAPILNTNATSFLARDEILSTIELPPIPTGMGHGRMTLNNFSASIKILGASSARTRMVVNVDPNLHFLPQSMIDFCMKRMCGVLLAKLQVAAQRVMKDPIKNPHARRMREDVRFYRDWLLPKFRSYCDELGWVMPPVKALEVSENDLKAEDIFEGWRSVEDVLENNPQNDLDEAHASMQQYKIEDIDPDPSVNAHHRRTKSESGNEFTPRIRKRDRLKGLLGLSSFNEDNSDGTPSHAPSETSTRIRKRDKFKQLFHEKETKEEKIAAARQKALARLQPEPFSQSKMERLRELKNAKARTETRLLRKSSLRESRSGESLSGSFSRSVFGTNNIDESDEDDDVKRTFMIFIIGLLVNGGLLRVTSYATTILELPPHFELSSIDWADLIPRNLLTILIICSHATLLWATLNTFLVLAFDHMDFGQKHLATNLEYGKKLYIDAVKKYSRIASVLIAAVSLCVGLISAIFQNVISKLCVWISQGFPMPSLHMSDLFPDKYMGIVDSISISVWVVFAMEHISARVLLVKELILSAIGWVNMILHQIHITYAFECMVAAVRWGASKTSECVFMAVSWTTSKRSHMIPSILKRVGNSVFSFLFESLPNTIVSHLSVCKDHTTSNTLLSWRYEAVQFSSFVTSRLAVFVLALLFMSYLVLPKPEKKLSKKKAVSVKHPVPMRQIEMTTRPAHRRAVSSRSSESIPMEVIRE